MAFLYKHWTLPLGLQQVSERIWYIFLPVILEFPFQVVNILVVQCIYQLFQSGISLIALTILLEYCNKIYWLQYTTENRKCTDNWWPMSSTVMWSLFVNFFFLNLLIYLNQGGQLELSNEFFHEVKPGLSSYADNPKQVSTEVCSKEKKMIVSLSLPPPPPTKLWVLVWSLSLSLLLVI